MPQSIKFHLDENVDHAIARGLRLHGIDVTTTADAGLIGADDLKQITFAQKTGRVIFSHDDDLLTILRQTPQHTGIVFCAKNRRTIGHIIKWLITIWQVLDPEDMANQVEFI